VERGGRGADREREYGDGGRGERRRARACRVRRVEGGGWRRTGKKEEVVMEWRRRQSWRGRSRGGRNMRDVARSLMSSCRPHGDDMFYRVHADPRWIGRQLLEVISSEFRDRSVDYYVSPVDNKA
jgi:hypothetical protein